MKKIVIVEAIATGFKQVVMRDLALLKQTEEKFFGFLLNDGMTRRWFMDSRIEKNDFERIIKECGCHGAILAAGDEPWQKDGVQSVTPETLDDSHKGFDNVIVGYQKALTERKESDCLKLLFETMDRVKPGGRVIFPESTYAYLSYKREGAELLLQIKDLCLQDPLGGLCKYVIGIKE